MVVAMQFLDRSKWFLGSVLLGQVGLGDKSILSINSNV